MTKPTGKLVLGKETIRTLTSSELDGANGGTSVFRISMSWADLFNKIGRFAGNNVAKNAPSNRNDVIPNTYKCVA